MLEFFKNSVKALTDRVKKAGPEWTRQCIPKGKSSVLDLIMLENGNGRETEIHVCAADVGSTDHRLIWINIQQTRVMKNRRGRKSHK